MIKGSRLIAIVMLLLLSLACFISAPVFAEGPWDGDAHVIEDGGGGTITDTTDHGDDSDGDGVLRDDKPEGDTDWEWVILKSIIRIIFISVTNGGTSNPSLN